MIHEYLARLLLTLAILLLFGLVIVPKMIANLSERLNNAVTPEVRVVR
jgi:hypothetical protein